MGILNKENLDNAFGKIKKATSDFISTVSDDNSAKDKKYSYFCTNCGTGLAANEKFCHSCGTAVATNTKAEILFSNEADFVGIQKLYFNKMKELKIKVN